MDELSVQELSDEDLAKLVAMGAIPEQQAQLQKQLQQAQMLQNGAMPEMRGNSRVQTAANPLEFLARGMQQYKGMRDEKNAMAKIDELQKQATQGRQLFAQRMLDTPYRRASQPFMQQPTEEQLQVPMPAMSF